MHFSSGYHIILASKSPRRQQLLKSLDIDFEVRVKEVEETYPPGLAKEEIPVYLARLKARPFLDELKPGELLITADTIVWCNNRALGKPSGKEEAFGMISQLSGSEHQVISGVCLPSIQKQKSFFSVSIVRFKTLSHQEIDYYINTYEPYDKAGGYGIQEWIGFIGVSHIEGSFYNVMGLPTQKLFDEIGYF